MSFPHLGRTTALTASAAALTAAFSAPAALAAPTPGPAVPAARAAPGGTSIGGPLLASRGVVVHLAPGVPAPPKVSASGYVVADMETGQVLAAKDAHGRFLPASTLKILTAITLIPRLDPAQTVQPSWDSCNVDGTRVGLVTTMRYRVDDLFRGLLMVSGNDAALALAQAAGGLPKTLALMNAEARRLHADDTVAKTPNGLDADGQYSSPYDLVLFAREGLRNPTFRRYVATVQYRFPAPPTARQKKKHQAGGYMIYNHNRLLTQYPGAIGVKNGYTSKAQASFVGAATRHGHTIIIALMHSKPYFWQDAEALLTWGFQARGRVQPVGWLVAPDDAAQTPPAAVAARTSPRLGRKQAGPVSRPAVPVAVGALILLSAFGYVLVRRRG